MALDSAGTLHYASASHLGPINGIAYAQWNGDEWSSPVDAAQTGAASQDEREGYEPRIMVTQGNQVHLVYLGPEHAQVFYVTTRSDAPPLTPEPSIVTVTPFPTIDPSPPTSPPPQETAIPTFAAPGGGSAEPTSGVSRLFAPVLFGALPAALVLAVVLLIQFKRRRR